MVDTGKVIGTILVVEDDDAVQELFRVVLENEGGYLVHICGHAEGFQALETQLHTFSLLIVDATLGERTQKLGLQIIEGFRKRSIALPPVLICSAHIIERKWLEKFQAAHLSKPFNVEELLLLVKRLM